MWTGTAEGPFAITFGMKNGNLLDEGRVIAPKGPGLGIEVAWDQLAEADFYRHTKRGKT